MRSPEKILLVAAAGVGLASVLSLTDARPADVGANPKDTPTPTPSSSLYSAEGMPSQKDIKQLARQLLEGKESIQSVQRSISFVNPSNELVGWSRDNIRWGIPPNNPEKLAGTVDVSINNNYSYSFSFQTKNSLYREITNGTAIRTTIDGLVVNTTTWNGYLATAVMIDNIAYERVERIANANNPTDLSDGARELAEDLIGDIAQNGDLGDFYEGRDSQGSYLNVVITHAVDPAKNGEYRKRLASQGKFLGSFFKVASAEPTSTPTTTATPYVTPISTTIEPTPGNIYTMTTANNQSSLIIPAEAAGSSVLLAQIHQVTPPADLPAAISALGATEVILNRTDGSRITVLATNTTLIFPYDRYNLPESQLGTLVVYDADKKQYLFPSIDRTKKEVSVKTNRFSIFALAKAILPIPRLNIPFSSKLQTELFACPTVTSFCKDAKNYQNSSFSAVLPPNTPLFAAYDGLIMGVKTKPAFKDDQNYSIIVLVDEQKTLQAEYAYIGEIPETRKVKKGEQIATASGKPIFSFANNSLNFQLIKTEGTANGKMNLQPDKFIN